MKKILRLLLLLSLLILGACQNSIGEAPSGDIAIINEIKASLEANEYFIKYLGEGKYTKRVVDKEGLVLTANGNNELTNGSYIYVVDKVNRVEVELVNRVADSSKDIIYKDSKNLLHKQTLTSPVTLDTSNLANLTKIRLAILYTDDANKAEVAPNDINQLKHGITGSNVSFDYKEIELFFDTKINLENIEFRINGYSLLAYINGQAYPIRLANKADLEKVYIDSIILEFATNADIEALKN